MAKNRSKYEKYRQQLLLNDPHCSRCGQEHGVGHEECRLHYHHTRPQHTGETDHSQGVLLCRRCHSILHGLERRAHKVVDEHGYTHGTFAGQPRRKRERRKAKAERLTDAWT